ncbi:MAG: hypothetical protein LBD75_07400 [Candidatus Peribacteria bacterium]|nr:hypothetical protein [Candidatus Peribacteria bacterium]
MKPLSKNNADIGVGRFGQTYTFNFPASSDIQMGDVLTINGKKYSVSTPPAPLTALRINVLECILELQNG